MSASKAAKSAKAYLRLFGAYFKANLQAAMEYRANFLLQVFGMALNNAAFIVFWRVLIDRTGGVGGYSFEDVMFLWALASAAFGLGHVLFGNARSIGKTIIEGGLDVYLLQPKDVFFSLISARSVMSAWGDLLYGYVLFVSVLGWGGLGLFSLFVATGALLYTATFAMAESLSFFFGNAQGVSGAVFEFLLSFTLYPETIFGPQVRWIIYSLIPAGFIVFVPLAVFTSFDWWLLAAVLAASVVYMVAARLVFKAGLRRYESGNLIGTRM